MLYLDWYLRLDEKSRESGYDLGLLICPDPETVVRKIIPKAVEIACRNTRKQNRRDGPDRKHWKMYFTDPQLFQIGILEASRIHLQQSECPPANWLIRYIGFLSLCTLQRNSFYVAIGFERILNTGSARDILELYEWLSYRLSPNGPSLGRDEKSANDIYSSLHEQIYREFKDSFQTSGHRLMFDKVPKGSGDIDEIIYRVLDKMIPWGTDHLPTANKVYARSYERIMVEMSLAHVCIDQQRCLQNVKRDNDHISGSFDTWRVPIPNSAAPVEPPSTRKPNWQDVEEEIMKEIHWLEEKFKRGWGSNYEVVVDDEIKDSIARGGSVEISLPPFARYVEIRDAESKMMLANCHLMDPHDLPEAGWKSSIEVPSGGRINFHLSQDLRPDEMVGMSMKIDIKAERSLATSLKNWMGQALRPHTWSGRGKSLAWAACAASLTLALLMPFIALSGLRDQMNHLQQENAELRTQISALSALEAQVAELQQSQIQTPNSPPKILEALHDGSSLVALDGQGNLTGVESIPQRFQEMIKDALATGQAATPELSSLGPMTAKLMGDNIGSETFALVSPVGVVIETARPTFRWKPLKGAINYSIIVSDSDYNEVAAGKSLSATEWTSDRPLERGKVYSWQVVALKEGREIKSPGKPGDIAKFQVLDQAKADDLAQAKKTHLNSHLMMGLLYARAGLLDEARRELNALLRANPKSPAAHKLLRDVERRDKR